MLLDLVPNKKVQRLKYIVDTIDAGCVALFDDKKVALARGDEELVSKVEERKDVMSVLCELFV